MYSQKYRAFPKVKLENRKWPDNEVTKAPVWCSVDLRDGNQALVDPMSVEQKLAYFQTLVQVGFKEIEVAFPSASDTDFQFVRTLIEGGYIPDDVTIQVLTQAREHLIDKTFEALKGVNKAIIHVYNSTSTLQRDVVFGKSKEEVKQIAISGVEMIKARMHLLEGSDITLEYSPESFMGTELDYSLEVIHAVLDTWEADKKDKTIINLPLTVEEMMPNVFADQVEYITSQIKYRDRVQISIHTHNDRGTGNAASELALLAGADRIEGTLFGNGERTGNADIVTLALNLYTQGIDMGLDFSEIDKLVESYVENVGMEVAKRHPYAGELVYTAFSGSHQDAINKGLDAMEKRNSQYWQVPYLTIDPKDVGRSYEAIIRINSQSGKGGVAYILKSEYGYDLPKAMHAELGRYVKDVSDTRGHVLSTDDIHYIFKRVYTLDDTQLLSYQISESNGEVQFFGEIVFEEKTYTLSGQGNGPIDAFVNSFKKADFGNYNVVGYSEHALATGSDAKAITYMQVADDQGHSHYGVGISVNTTRAAIDGILAAVANIKKNIVNPRREL